MIPKKVLGKSDNLYSFSSKGKNQIVIYTEIRVTGNDRENTNMPAPINKRNNV